MPPALTGLRPPQASSPNCQRHWHALREAWPVQRRRSAAVHSAKHQRKPLRLASASRWPSSFRPGRLHARTALPPEHFRRACWRRGGRFGLAHELLLVGQHSRGLSGRHRLDHRPRRVEHHIDRAAGDGREGSEREEEFFDGWSPRRASPFTAKKAATACRSPPFLSSLGLIWGEVSERQQGRREKSKPCKNHCASAEPDCAEREPADNKDDRGSRAWMRSPSGTTSSSACAM